MILQKRCLTKIRKQQRLKLCKIKVFPKLHKQHAYPHTVPKNRQFLNYFSVDIHVRASFIMLTYFLFSLLICYISLKIYFYTFYYYCKWVMEYISALRNLNPMIHQKEKNLFVFMYAPWCGKYCIYICSEVWQVLCLYMLRGVVSIVFTYAQRCGKYCVYICSVVR